MTISLDLTGYWYTVATIAVILAGAWGFRRVKSLFASR
jgi:hypothetical protein